MRAPSREVRLAELMAALSLATDLGMGQPLEQALRYCLLALDLARRAGCEARTLSDVYYLALLEHIGCTATAAEIAAWNGGDDLAFRRRGITLADASTGEVVPHLARHLGEGHPRARRVRLAAVGLAAGERRFERLVALQCEGGARLADRLGMGEGVREGLGHVYERWDGMGAPRGLAGEQISLAQRVVTVAHDAVVHAQLSGPSSAPGADRSAARRGLRPGGLRRAPLRPGLAGPRRRGGRPVDARARGRAGAAPYRAGDAASGRGTGVRGLCRPEGALPHGPLPGRRLAARAAGGTGSSRDAAAALRLAGLLHDVGRLGVPNGIWEKPGALTLSERERVRLHPYLTERILARTSILAPLAVCAACHHERLDGSGYHRGAAASQLTFEARLLAAADVYDAMTHDRPYRPPLDAAQARAELRAEVESGRLDQRTVNAVLEAAGDRPLRVRGAWPAGLSDREVEVLRLLARGKTNRQIAAALVIAEKTVGRHVENIYGKTGLSTRAGAALFAAEHELLD